MQEYADRFGASPEDIGKMVSAYSGGVVNSLTVAPLHEEQILLEVKFAEVDRTKLQQFGINFFSTGAANTVGTVSTQQINPPQLSTSGGSGSTATGSINVQNPLNVFAFRLPTLRERKEDLPLLVQAFINEFNTRNQKTIAGVDHRAMRMLEQSLMSF